MKLAVFAAVALSVQPAFAWSESEQYDAAKRLGSVIAAESFCGMSYKQSAISGYVERTVPADDMGFASILDTEIYSANYDQGEMEQSQKTAHCTQMRRVAKSYGFID
ncbi:hypothetical protein AB1K42_15160 [Roseibium algicola]|uniref:hypothetical protein n=1 Tax=Roseibium algicola TaxID=2857014 RepID=UPI00345A4544